MPKTKRLKNSKISISWVLFCVFSAIAFLLFLHPDVMETSNHSYLLLDSIFKGRFFHFYDDIMAHQNQLYYINFAHYNIFIYLLFGIALLPLYCVTALFRLAPAVYEPWLWFVGKAVSTAFYVGCILMIKKIAGSIGFSSKKMESSALRFALWPPAFFSVFVMGQYDSIALFFILLGVYYWTKEQTLAFSLSFGVAICCKFFAILLFVPLLLLIEKRVLHFIKYGVLSLWLLLPTSLLFFKRTGDMGFFNKVMTERLFNSSIAGFQKIALFPMLFLILCFTAYVWKPAAEKVKQAGIWFCLAAFCLLFFFVEWHPQWLILIAPFIVLSTGFEKSKEPFLWLDIALGIGFFVYCAMYFPYQLEANLLDFGLLGTFTGLKTTASLGYNSIGFYVSLIPMLPSLSGVLLGGAFACHLVFKLPFFKNTPAAYLTKGTASYLDQHPTLATWLVFSIPFLGWLAATLFTWLKCIIAL